MKIGRKDKDGKEGCRWEGRMKIGRKDKNEKEG